MCGADDFICLVLSFSGICLMKIGSVFASTRWFKSSRCDVIGSRIDFVGCGMGWSEVEEDLYVCMMCLCLMLIEMFKGLRVTCAHLLTFVMDVVDSVSTNQV